MLHNIKQDLSKDQFDLILDHLLTDAEFRKMFFSNPLDALRKMGISLTPEESIALNNAIKTNISEKIAEFNEKLVLCSSSC